MKQLDEKGFVFLDANGRPFYIRMWGGEPWLFRWHADNRWVSMRRVNQSEIWAANTTALPEEQANLYHQQNEMS